MLDAHLVASKLAQQGVTAFTGVPCSSLGSLINAALDSGRYLVSANEGDALAVCAGMHLGGGRAALLMQNSGLSNAASPFTSLTHTFAIPVLAFVSLRGEVPEQDEPQHRLMGGITTRMLDLMDVEWAFLSAEPDEAEAQLARAQERLAQDRSFCFVVKPGTLAETKLSAPPAATGAPRPFAGSEPGVDPNPSRPKRSDALQALLAGTNPRTALLATTGKTGRELHDLADAARNFYVVGSMGCLSSLAFGVALATPQRRVVAIDGDGALLMRLGALPAIASRAPGNLLHVVLDNGTYDSTGGQPTLSPLVDFARVASACGYPRAFAARGLGEFERRVREWSAAAQPELTLLHLRIAPGSLKVGRPRLTPVEVKQRFMAFLKG